MVPISEHINELRQLLRNLSAQNSEIEGATVVSVQGLPIVAAMATDANEGIVAAMSAAIVSVGERAAEELARGKLQRILIEGDVGTFILSQAGPQAILCVLCQKDAALGMIFLTMQSAARKIEAILG
ncbi:MAG: roadblock/LC7 domain-containing protein [Promethearchaeota archaeon]